ncbi:hypothetical protein [Vibrio ezurae]|uniref:Uncharacterized protein n=1 Tax=Vibrio ezurae NBRC 102218 TaxID=1219080 RepID=U3CGY9_9VIBR|nr:hypothetical protein [Vibrio ezurae]GAD80479.1 hypothetical protein VEZ01S_37_00440 [Vibrio ezurae NBRC 102218]
MMIFMYSVVAISSVSLGAVHVLKKKTPNARNKTTEDIAQYLKETHYWAEEYQHAKTSYQRLYAELMQKVADINRHNPAQRSTNNTALNELKVHVEQRKQRMLRAEKRYQQLTR